VRFNSTMMLVHDLTRDGQAQSVSAATGHLGAAKERHKQAVKLAAQHARAAVPNAHSCLVNR
jgi:hypothetical protein